MIDRIGQQLGNYRLVYLLGEGGFAEVYLGEHIHLGTKAAIKILRSQLTRDNIETFRNEARTIARLDHPHIIHILDFGVDDRTPFLVMNYAAKGSLRQCHPKGTRLPLVTVVSYVKQVADALQFAHDQKLIHRDIKPENMLLGQRNNVLLSDFGIAIVAQSSHHQSMQDMVGTMAYMAPEQIQGKPRPASDQYSLGVVVYEWLLGDRPFHGPVTELVGQHLSTPPPSLRKKIPELSPAVEEAVFTALSKDSHRRFTNVLGFATALERAYQNAHHLFPNPPLEGRLSNQLGPFVELPTPTKTEALISPVRQNEAAIDPVIRRETLHKRTAKVDYPGNAGGRKYAARMKFGDPVGGMRMQLIPAITLIILTLMLVVGIVIAASGGLSFLDSSNHRVGLRILTSTSSTQKKTVRSTGSIPGIRAMGPLTFLNTSNSTKSFGSVILRGASGVPITFNGTITVPATPPDSVTVTGFAVNIGSAGNIGALDISGSCCAAGITVRNGAFSGGQDPQPDSVVQKSDIDGAATALVASLTPGVRTAMQRQMQPNERVVANTFQCHQSTFTATHKAGDHANSVTVTVAITCKEEFYAS